MLVTGIDGVYDIDLEDVDYFYVKNHYLIFFRTTGNYTAVEMSGNYTANLSGREYFNENWRNFATILNTDNGRSYYINVANVASHSASSSSVVVNFAINILTVACEDSATATWDNQYLTDVRGAYRFLTDFSGSFKEVGSGKTYATIALANAAASSGDCVRVYAGTYAEDLTGKNGVYYYFEGTDSILAGKITYPRRQRIHFLRLRLRNISAKRDTFFRPHLAGFNH